MYYIIYKITNKLNGKFYIGQHKTENLNDGYMGSGVAIKNAIKTHGVENFSKEILFFCVDNETMENMEEVLVDDALVARRDTYNLMTGGKGGYTRTEEHRRKIGEASKGRHPSEEHRRKISEVMKGNHHNPNFGKSNKGKPKSEEHKRKIGDAIRGKHWHRKQKSKTT